MTDIEAAVVAELDRIGLPYELIPCDPELADTAAFCEHYGYSPDISANTIVVASKRGKEQYVACVVLATTRLDVNHAVRRRMGAKKVSFASPEETSVATGMMIGGVTPLALPAGLPVYVDAEVMRRDEVILGAGSRSAKVKVSPRVLERVPEAEIVEGLAH